MAMAEFFRLYVFGPLGLKDYGAANQILPSGNLGLYDPWEVGLRNWKDLQPHFSDN